MKNAHKALIIGGVLLLIGVGYMGVKYAYGEEGVITTAPQTYTAMNTTPPSTNGNDTLAASGAADATSGATTATQDSTGSSVSISGNENTVGAPAAGPRGASLPVSQVPVRVAVPTNSRAPQAPTTPRASNNGVVQIASATDLPVGYTEAINRFGNGYRLQIAACKAVPSGFAIKQGVEFMIDNRDNAPHVFRLGSQVFNVPAYGFAIVSAEQSGDLALTCDGGGSALLDVQP